MHPAPPPNRIVANTPSCSFDNACAKLIDFIDVEPAYLLV